MEQSKYFNGKLYRHDSNHRSWRKAAEKAGYYREHGWRARVVQTTLKGKPIYKVYARY